MILKLSEMENASIEIADIKGKILKSEIEEETFREIILFIILKTLSTIFKRGFI